MAFYEKRCPHCNEWTDGNLATCTHCNERLFELQEKELEKREQRALEINLPLIKIYPTDNIIIKLFKYIIRGGQIIYFGLIWFIVYFATVVVG